MNYLDIVNSVLRRLRENEVSSVQETPYSKLIGDLVNVVKREVEDSWDWSALRTTLTAITTANVFNYELEDSTTRIRILDMFNDTDNIIMQQRSTKWFDRQFLMTDPEKGSPYYYNFNGVSPEGNTQVDFYPIPDGVYNLRINCIIPQARLEANTDRILIPADVVIEGAIYVLYQNVVMMVVSWNMRCVIAVCCQTILLLSLGNVWMKLLGVLTNGWCFKSSKQCYTRFLGFKYSREWSDS